MNRQESDGSLTIQNTAIQNTAIEDTGAENEDSGLQLPPRDPMGLSWQSRVLAFLSGICVLAVLLVARSLEPEARGFGTHQQLGLPPCTSVVLFNMLCPSCGMTTSWSLAMRGRWLEAGNANAGGLLLSIIAMAYLPAACYFTYLGKVTRGGWFSLALAISILVALAIAIAQWLWRLWM